MRKTSFWGTAVVLVSVLFASCGFFGGSYDGPISTVNVSGDIKFDFSGAKAVAKLEDTTSRAAVTDDELGNIIKILADDTIEPVITVDGNINLSEIRSIYKSPVSDDVFVVFNYMTTLSEWYDTESDGWKWSFMGRLICVRPDGTVLDILKIKDVEQTLGTWKGNVDYLQLGGEWDVDSDPVVFDASGNLYFIATENTETDKGGMSSICGIWKFDSSSATLTQMVAPSEGTNYTRLRITGDGSWILTEGTRAGPFLRAIPVSNPDAYVNIYYSSDGVFYSSRSWWVYDDNSGTVYYTLGGNNQGLYTVSRAGGFKDKIFRGKYIGGNPYDWFADFFDGKIEAEDVLNRINNFCVWDIEFRYTYLADNQYITLKDAEALEYIKTNDNEKEFVKSLLYDNGYIYNNCYIKGTDKRLSELSGYPYVAIIPYGTDYDFTSFSDFFATEKGVYAHYWSYTANNLCVIQIADENGNLVERTSKILFPEGKRLAAGIYDDQVVLLYALTDSSGFETGFHRLYSVDMNTGEIINRCENVANGDRLEITSYSVGADNLYFSAVRGTTIENHVINLITNQSNPLSTITRKVVAFYAF